MREPGFWHGPASLNAHLLKPLAALWRRRRTAPAAQGIECRHHGALRRQFSRRRCRRDADRAGAGEALARTRRDAGRAQPGLWREIAGAGQGRSGQACGFRCRRRALDAGRHAAGGGVAQARGRRTLVRAQGATVILMDDGFQSPAVVKDASLIVMDGARGLGNGQVFPPAPCERPAAATGAHRRADRCRRWPRRGKGVSGDRGARQAGVVGASEAG